MSKKLVEDLAGSLASRGVSLQLLRLPFDKHPAVGVNLKLVEHFAVEKLSLVFLPAVVLPQSDGETGLIRPRNPVQDGFFRLFLRDDAGL